MSEGRPDGDAIDPRLARRVLRYKADMDALAGELTRDLANMGFRGDDLVKALAAIENADLGTGEIHEGSLEDDDD